MSTDEILHLYNQTFNAWNVVLMVCVVAGIKVFGEVFPEAVAKQPPEAPLWQKMPHRLLPVYPIWACTFCYVFIPGPWIDSSLSLGQKVMLGVLCGFVAGHSQKTLRSFLPAPLAAMLDTKRRASGRRSEPLKGETEPPSQEP